MVTVVMVLAVSGLPCTGCSNKMAKSTVLEEPKNAGNITAPPSAPVGRGETGPGTAERVVTSLRVAPSATEAQPALSKDDGITLLDIFFDFDRYAVRNDAKSALSKNATYLAAHKGAGLLIEGHCDERGTSEYNMALGEKRAQSVKDYMKYLGVDVLKLNTVSYGSERPFCSEHNEQCWQENRRAHFVVK